MSAINDIFQNASSSIYGGNLLNDFDRFNVKHEFIEGSSSIESNIEGYMCIDKITVVDKMTQESTSTTLDLLFVPTKTEVGYSINNSNKQVVSLYKRSPGWYISKEVADKKDESKIYVEASYVVNGRKIISFEFHPGKMRVIRPKAKAESNTNLGVFLRAVTNCSYDEIINKIGITSNALLRCMKTEEKAFGHLSISDCVDQAIDVLHYKTRSIDKDNTDNIYTLQNLISPNGQFKADEVNRSRLNTLISFRERALNKTLSRPLSFTYNKVIDGKTVREKMSLDKGTILTAEVLEAIDNSDVTTLFVEYLSRTYELKKYPQQTDYRGNYIFSPEEFFTIANMAITHLEGYPLEQDEYDVNNRLVEDLDGAINSILENRLRDINLDLDAKFTDFYTFHKNDENARFSTMDFFENMRNIDTLELVDRLRSIESKEVQTSDLDNIIAFESKNSKIMIASGGIGGDDMTKVQNLQFGRLDPCDQPESQKIGMVHIKAHLAKYDKFGQITAPYVKVENGKVISDRPVYLTADQELNKYIAEWNETFETPNVKARYNGTIISVPKNRINYMQYSPVQDMSLARAFVVFQNHNNAKRLQMSCNHMKQAEILSWGERPRVSTGYASIAKTGIFTAEMLLEEHYNESSYDMPLEEFKKQSISIQDIALKGKMREITFKINESGKLFKKLIAFILPTGSKTIFMYRINSKNITSFKGLDIVLYNTGISIEECEKLVRADYGSLPIEDPNYTSSEAQGINLRVLYKTHEGSTVDDAIVISSAIVYSGMGTSPVISHLDYELNSSKDFMYVEKFQGSAPGQTHIGENGLPKVGTYLKHGDVFLVVHREEYVPSSTKKNSLDVVPMEPLIKRIENYVEGTVVHASIHNNKATILLAHNAELEVGDKWSGRHGNKGVTSKIVPEDEMPYDPQGRPYHIVLNPLGIPSRMNIGQVLEVQLSAAMSAADKYAIVSPYFPNDLNLVKEECEKYGIRPVVPYDGKTGLPYDREVLEGEIYMQKLIHRVAKKITARGLDGKKSAITQQPIKGKGVGGQSIGEMETWVLSNRGCNKFLQELMSIQSDDIKAKDDIKNIIAEDAVNVSVDEAENRNDKTLQVLARMMGTELSYNKGEVTMEPLTDKIIEEFSKPIVIRSIKDLQDGKKFGESFDSKKGNYPILRSKKLWYHIRLNCEIVHPIWLYQTSPLYKLIFVYNEMKDSDDPKLGNITKDQINKLINRKYSVYKLETEPFYRITNRDVDTVLYNGMEGLCRLIRNIKLEDIKESYNPADEKFDKATLGNKLKIKDTYKLICDMENTFNPEDYIISKFPILPRPWRPESPIENVTNDFDKRYMSIAKLAHDLKQSYSSKKVDQLYVEINGLLGINKDENGTRTDLQTILKYFVNKDTANVGTNSDDHGALRRDMLSKRIDMSARTVIIPQRDITKRPTQLGVPMYAICKIYATHLEHILKVNGFKEDIISYSDFLSLLSTQDKFSVDELFGAGYYDKVLKIIDNFLTTRVVVCGRQPTLHNSSIRAYIPYRSDTKCIEIHPLVCSAYNADFDGDQMWIAAPISNEAQDEVWEKLSIFTGIRSPKDSECLLDHNQDSLLGLYYGTMLHDNVTSVIRHPKYFREGIPFTNSIDLSQVTLNDVIYKVYDSIDAIELDISNKELLYQDLVLFRHSNGRQYFSTAGRLWLNSILPNGFTDKPFTNTLDIPMDEKTKSNISELAYDKLFCKSGKSQGIESQSVKKLNVFLFENNTPEDTIEYYHQMMVYGLKAAHISAISLPLKDIETYKYSPDYFSSAKVLEDQINRDYQCGIITEAEKKSALISLYKTLADILGDKVISSFPRNNNLFIMFDSGARGSKGQILQTVGIIGITPKTTTEELETPITTCYSEGLSCFDTSMSSYAGRTSVKSTQNDTAKSGYGTRQATFMTFGFNVVEHNCNKIIDDVDIMYTIPTSLTVKSSNGEVVDTFKFDSDVAVIKFTEILANKKYLLNEDDVKKYKAFITHNNTVKDTGIKVMLKNHVKRLVDNKGNIYEIKYAMDDMMKDLLLNRELDKSESLPYTKKLNLYTKGTIDYMDKESEANYDLELRLAYKNSYIGKVAITEKELSLPGLEEVHYITPATVKYIEDNNIEKVKVRLLLDCQSENGCCARCHGIKFESNELPEIGEDVGVVAAQSIGEPSTQLTMNMAHTGTSMANGVQFFMSLLKSSDTTFGFDSKQASYMAESSGYVSLKHAGSRTIVKINKKYTNRYERLNNTTLNEYSIPTNLLDVIDGEYVNVGDSLSKGIFSPNKYCSTANGDLLMDIVPLIKQRMLYTIKLYFDVFFANKLNIHARHFEMFAKLQNQYITGLKYDISEGSEFIEYTYPQLLKMDSADLQEIRFFHKLASQDEIILRSSGPLTSVCFEQLCRTVSRLTFRKYKGEERGLAGRLAIGQNLADLTEFKRLTKSFPGGSGNIVSRYKKIESVDLDVDNTEILATQIEDEAPEYVSLGDDILGLLNSFSDDADEVIDLFDEVIESSIIETENIPSFEQDKNHIYSNTDNTEDDLDDEDFDNSEDNSNDLKSLNTLASF